MDKRQKRALRQQQKRSNTARDGHFMRMISKLKHRAKRVMSYVRDGEPEPVQVIIMRERIEMTARGISKLKLTPTQRRLAEKEYQKKQARYLSVKLFNKMFLKGSNGERTRALRSTS